MDAGCRRRRFFYRTFDIDSLIQHNVSLVDNRFITDFDFLRLQVVRVGNGGVAALSEPGSTTFTPFETGLYQASVFAEPGSLFDPGSDKTFVGGQFGVTIAAVPEPETWAMMLIGVGLVGWQLRRKVKASAASRFV